MDFDDDISNCTPNCNCNLCQNVYSLVPVTIQEQQLKYNIKRFNMYTEESA